MSQVPEMVYCRRVSNSLSQGEKSIKEPGWKPCGFQPGLPGGFG